VATYEALISQLKKDLTQSEESLRIWEGHASVVRVDANGKQTNLRAEMIARHKANMLKYRDMIAALEEKQK
jgi:hypothetical protein